MIFLIPAHFKAKLEMARIVQCIARNFCNLIVRDRFV